MEHFTVTCSFNIYTRLFCFTNLIFSYPGLQNPDDVNK